MDVPYSPNGLKIAMKQFPDVFAWRNDVISFVETLLVPKTP